MSILRDNSLRQTSVAAGSSVASLSLRDPAGQLFDVAGRLVRIIRRSTSAETQPVLNSPAVRNFVRQGTFVDSVPIPQSDTDSLLDLLRDKLFFPRSEVGAVVEHPRVPFISYPYEWAPEMLSEAGRLTLDIAEALLGEGLGLKDATPYNVLFNGAKPVFVDLLSVESRPACDPIWLAHAQFTRTFLNPLWAARYFDLPLHTFFQSRRDGLQASELYPLCGPIQKWLPPHLGLITLPALLSRGGEVGPRKIYRQYRTGSEEKSQFILHLMFNRLKKTLRALAPSQSHDSFWSRYTSHHLPYDEEQRIQKKTFVERVLRECQPKSVLDVGCNTGEFSQIAARAGAHVVAFDSDPTAVGKTWRLAQGQGLNILPLVIDLSNPSPAGGWNNSERASFLERAHGAFDLVFMLAVAHHMMITDGIPLGEILKMAASLTRDQVIFEFIGSTDPMFLALAKGREYSGYSQSAFEQECEKHFSITHAESLTSGTRRMYCLKKKRAHAA